ncbi:hypothetical protein QYM36_012593 [Artemia franciscana]|uniref:Dynein light chain n=1 Tax=Artemia franciscana TaxID=6661 RepID=A0AA88L800_ARTSF|nr:hypothetical protein QYM36_012593 [Artemia franciscana]
MTDRKAVIKNADMSEEMQQDAVDCATQALEKYNIEKRKEIAKQLLDSVISSLKERFELMENHSGSFKFLYHIQSLQNFVDKEELKKSFKHLQIVLSEGENCNVNCDELFEE